MQEQAKKNKPENVHADAMYKRRNFSPEQVADAVFDAVIENPAVLPLVGAKRGRRVCSVVSP